MSDPHQDDYCVVCGKIPTSEGPAMNPVSNIENGNVCDDCIGSPVPMINVDVENSILDRQATPFNIPDLPCQEDSKK